ncbi:MAG: 2-hydroxyacyl-CoA dehydratase [Peptococcaceae bacterium]|nr:2-hydroxyacyl-CoA dehydratase [Peptococcaceae bacterium]
MNQLKVGLDVGSTTVKVVVLNESDTMIFSDYQRHFSDVSSTVHKLLENLGRQFPEAAIGMAVTGSSGITTSAQLNIPFVQEVIACSEAVRRFVPETDVAVELGGEDAKITYFGDAPELRMNGTCAGGTGAFIDQMATLLKTDAQGLNDLAAGHKVIYPIASRCGVFAKTDVQPLLNEGAAKEDIAASIFQAVVNQTIAGLACGKPIRGKVAFLGGPLSFLPQLRQRFIETLNLQPEDIIFPENAQLFVALGACYSAEPLTLNTEPRAANTEPANPAPSTMADLMSRLDNLHNTESEGSHLEPLFADAADYEAFALRHSGSRVVRRELSQARGTCFLGIDAGSTTTKLALIDEDGALLYSHYGSNDGSPLYSTVKALRQMAEHVPENLTIGRAVVTGYGEALLKAALKVDHGEIETVAHLKGAEHFLPGVDFILDIGGQDMKCMQISDGVINNIMLNEACSSGCGSFIETLAKSLGISIEDFVQKGIYADPVDLGTRCTVFMNSKIKQVQKEGAPIGSIAAGIAYSVVKNALYKVIRLNSAAQVGQKIVVQGGTFYNDAVLRSFERITGHQVVRPDIAGIMGAFGAALVAKAGYVSGETTRMLLGEDLQDFHAESATRYCGLCGNNCLLTVNKFPGDRELITGNRCERGGGAEQASASVPNLFDYKYKRLFAYKPLAKEAAPRGEIGLPRGLNMYEHYPFWFTFFTDLGFRVVLSSRSSKKIFELGMETVSSESICYPAKLMNGHIIDLVNRGVKTIFYPCLPRDEKEDPGSNNNFNCPVVTSYPQSIQANVDLLRAEDMTFLYPFLPMDNMERLKIRLTEELSSLGLKKDEIGRAVDKAYAERLACKADIRAKGEETLAWLTQNKRQGIVLAGRPYHTDPEIHHGIPEMITGFGLAVLTEDSVAHLGQTPRPLRVLDQWMYHTRLYAAASFATTRDDIELVQLNSFGCGLDAVTTDQVHELLEQYRKTYTLIKIDEINNLGAVRIRIRSLLAAMEERVDKGIVAAKRHELPERRIFTEEMRETHTILCPQMSPIQFAVLEEALRFEGYNLQVLPDVAMDVVEQGLLHVHNDACYPTIIVVGQIMAALKSGAYDLDKTAVLMTQTGGGCRASNYVGFIRKALKDAGMEQIPVISLNALGWEKNPGWTMSVKLIKRAVMACIYGDLLMRLTMAVRPYEKVPNATNELLDAWIAKTRQAVTSLKKRPFHANIRQIIRDFSAIEVNDVVKPKVGIVGEILVKFHPFANNYLVDVLESEGAEAVMPDLLDFLLYCLYNSVYSAKKLSGTLKQSLINRYLIWHMELYRRHMKKQLKRSRFSPPGSIYHKAKLAQKVVHLGHSTGEGWFLTGEMLELLESGTDNIACLQPFGCLPNHILGKGVMRELKRQHPEANIVAIDYDPGASHVNQLNRIKLMLSVAFEKCRKTGAAEPTAETTPTETTPMETPPVEPPPMETPTAEIPSSEQTLTEQAAGEPRGAVVALAAYRADGKEPGKDAVVGAMKDKDTVKESVESLAMTRAAKAE